MFFDNDFKSDNLSLFLEYENLIEFEKCILVFALYKEFNATKYDLNYDEDSSLKECVFLINDLEYGIIFDDKSIRFYGDNDSRIYEKYINIIRNKNNILDNYINKMLKSGFNNDYDDIFDRINSFEVKSKFVYKFYSEKSIICDEKLKKIKNRNVTFSHQKYFNDPFDCKSLKSTMIPNINVDNFRIFSCIKEYKTNVYPENIKNILMWAHYGDSFKGYCFEYNFSSLMSQLRKKTSCLPGHSIVIRGDVKYGKKPENVGLFPFKNSNFQRIVNTIFNKCDVWSYENEYRIVVINDSFSKEVGGGLNNEFFMIDEVIYDSVFVGEKNATLVKSDYKTSKFAKVKSDKPYKLKIVTI